MNRLIFFLLLIVFGSAAAQELNCTVIVNTEKLQNANQQVFRTLQTSLNEFVNKTQWTGKKLKSSEKINCSMNIVLSSYDSDNFSGTIQVQSSRLVFNSTYFSPVFNFNDKDFNFTYTEYQPLIFNPSEFQSNLVSVISFYCHIILGLDADTFSPSGGNPYFEIAQNITTVAQQSGNKGWSQSDGLISRYFIVNDLMSNTFKDIRESSLMYHSGLDLMAQDLKLAKEKVKLALINVGKLNSLRPNAFVTRMFFDAKSDEIVSIFSGGPSIPIDNLVESLNRCSPPNSSKWANIKY